MPTATISLPSPQELSAQLISLRSRFNACVYANPIAPRATTPTQPAPQRTAALATFQAKAQRFLAAFAPFRAVATGDNSLVQASEEARAVLMDQRSAVIQTERSAATAASDQANSAPLPSNSRASAPKRTR